MKFSKCSVTITMFEWKNFGESMDYLSLPIFPHQHFTLRIGTVLYDVISLRLVACSTCSFMNTVRLIGSQFHPLSL